MIATRRPYPPSRPWGVGHPTARSSSAYRLVLADFCKLVIPGRDGDHGAAPLPLPLEGLAGLLRGVLEEHPRMEGVWLDAWAAPGGKVEGHYLEASAVRTFLALHDQL